MFLLANPPEDQSSKALNQFDAYHRVLTLCKTQLYVLIFIIDISVDQNLATLEDPVALVFVLFESDEANEPVEDRYARVEDILACPWSKKLLEDAAKVDLVIVLYVFVDFCLQVNLVLSDIHIIILTDRGHRNASYRLFKRLYPFFIAVV